MAKNYELIRQIIDVIRQETEDYANTAERVGSAIRDVLDFSNENIIILGNQLIDLRDSASAGIDNNSRIISAVAQSLLEETRRAKDAENLISQQVEHNFKNFSELGVEESAKMDGYEIALTKKTNTAEKTKVKVPVYDMQNPSATPVGLVDEVFVEDMKAEAKKMVDAEAERAEAKEQELSNTIGDWDKAMLGTIAEQVDSINGDVKVNQQDIAHNAEAIEAEAERAQAAEQALRTEIPVFQESTEEAIEEMIANGTWKEGVIYYTVEE